MRRFEAVNLGKKYEVLINPFNIDELNRIQFQKLICGISENYKTAFVLKNRESIAVFLSIDGYKKFLVVGVLLNECYILQGENYA